MRTVIDGRTLYEFLDQRYGGSHTDPLVMRTALFIFISNTYGLEENYLEKVSGSISLQEEVTALEIASSNEMRIAFNMIIIPTGYTRLTKIEFNLYQIIVYLE